MSNEQTTFKMHDQGVMMVRVGKKAKHTLTMAQEDLAALRGELKGARVPLLIDLTEVISVDTDAREYYAREAPSVATCVGLVTPSLVSKILGNFFIASTNFFSARSNISLRLFDDERSAVQWLVSVNTTETLRKQA